MIKLFYEQIPDDIQEKSERITEIVLILLNYADNLRLTYGIKCNEEFLNAVEQGCRCMDFGETMGPHIFVCANYKGVEMIGKIRELHPIWSDLLVKQLDEEKHMPKAKVVSDICLYHHEKNDGTGYPNKLVGEEIPFIAQLCRIAEDIDQKVYLKSGSLSQNFEQIKNDFKDKKCYSEKLKQCFKLAETELAEHYGILQCEIVPKVRKLTFENVADIF